MIYHLAVYSTAYLSFCNVVHYVSFRVMASLLTSVVSSFIFFPWFIQRSRIWFRSKVRQHTPERHQLKNDTPTMGGLLMVALVIVNILLWCNLAQINVWIFLGIVTGFAVLGAADDWRKIKHQRGLSALTKFITQWAIAFVGIALWYWLTNPPPTCIPFFKHLAWGTSWWIGIPWSMFVIVAISNAVNLTDGLDGLAISSLIPNFALYAILSYLAGHVAFAQYLAIPWVPTAEIAVIGAILVGTSLGFFWFNMYPAKIFMGDVGSLAFGAALGCMALMSRHELLLPLAGGLFMLETISVIVQVLSFKLRGKRLFKMAPIHHHFELLGWHETQITIRFGILSLLFCLLALMTIKLR